MNPAFSSGSDGADGDKFNGVVARHECHQHLGFDFEALSGQVQIRPGLKMDEAKAGLGVGQMASGVLRQFIAH
ncbi:MAG TPA: hypothetical protein VGJ73_19555, partial [Verrucomicrobiae bacterium]